MNDMRLDTWEHTREDLRTVCKQIAFFFIIGVAGVVASLLGWV